jgi:alanyl-tRNA synthetase
VIADHIRACAFLDRRRRDPRQRGPRLRAAPHRRAAPSATATSSAARTPSSTAGGGRLAAEMGEAYPELRRRRPRGDRRAATGGGALRPDHRATAWRSSKASRMAAARARRSTARPPSSCYDTYGFPLDLTADVCRERGVERRRGRLRPPWRARREQARAAGKFKMADGPGVQRRRSPPSTATSTCVCEHAKVTAIYVDGAPVAKAACRRRRGDRARPHAVLRRKRRPGRATPASCATPAPAWWWRTPSRCRPPCIGHQGRVVEGELELGDTFVARVNAERRARARCATTASRT